MLWLTHNGNGLGDPNKRRALFHHFHVKKYDLIFVQETHSTAGIEKRWNTEWGNKIWYDHGESNSKGVAIIFSKDVNVIVHHVIRSSQGRYLILYVTLNDIKLILANVYAPNNDSPEFFSKFFVEVEKFTPQYYIIGGDMNLALDPLVDRQGRGFNNDNAAKWLNAHLLNQEYVDVWRHLFPDKNGFTWRRLRPKPTFSRLDYFWVSQSFLQFIEGMKIIPGFRSDHSSLLLSVSFQAHKRGPGYWKFNTSLLKDKDYVDSINRLLDIEMHDVQPGQYKDKWELIKLAVRGSTIQYASRRQSSNRKKIDVLEKKLVRLEKELLAKSPLFHDTEEQIRLVKAEIAQIYKEKTKGAIIRAKANWEFLGEKSTSYFLKLEKRNFVNRTLYKLRTENDIVLDTQEEILEEIRDYYAKLYTSKGPINTEYVKKLEIPKIPLDLKEKLDKKITVTEISMALKDMPLHKSPGCDGLPADFYKVFYLKLKPFLLQLFEEIVHTKKFHLSARRGILSLLEKVGRDMIRLKNWRPLTLLNTDNKIYAKILAKRLSEGAQHIFHHSQTGFLKERHLAENILKINEIMHHCEVNQIDGIIVSFDFFKAFDTVEWEAIILAMEMFGFGSNFIDMVKVLYKEPLVCASNNGFWSSFFSPTRATRQGCCFSPIGFNLVVELLGLGIRQNTNIIGFTLNDDHIKSGQFADDLWTALIPNENNLNATLQEIQDFGNFSGLHINPDKCAVLRIGPFKHSDAKYYTLKPLFWSPGSIRILGIQVYPDNVVMYHENFLDKLDKVEDIFTSWIHRNLTPFGKIRIVNDLVNTLFMHKFLALPTPPVQFFRLYKHLVQDFLWDGKKVKISYSKLIQDYEKLGLKLVDLELKNIALKAAWPVRWRERKDSELNWLFQHLPIKDKRMWYCNLSDKDIQKLPHYNTLSTANSILEAWAKVNFQAIPESNDILSQILWGNSLIRRQNRPIFDQQLVNSNVDTILHITDLTTKTLITYDRLFENFGQSFDRLFYLGLLAAIPKQWKIEIRHGSFEEDIDTNYLLDTFKTGEKASKKLYWTLLHSKYPYNDTYQIRWNHELQKRIDDEEWPLLFPNFMKIIKPTRLRYFQYRVLTKTLTTNIKRSIWNISISKLCTFCKKKDETILHVLYECEQVRTLWDKVVKTIEHFFNVKVIIDENMVICNNYRGPNREIINFLIIVLKQHIYASKCLETIPTYVSYMNKLAMWYFVDKCFAVQDNKYEDCVKKWANLF